MRKKYLNDNYIALGIGNSQYKAIAAEYTKANRDENIPILLTAVNGDSLRSKDIIELATYDEWIEDVKESLDGTPCTYDSILKVDGEQGYRNYNLFKGINRSYDVGDINKLIGNNPKESMAFALLSKDEYSYRIKEYYNDPIDSFNSLWEFLYKPKYILIFKNNDRYKKN